MAEQPEVVIVDAEGTEHVFPAGFDPRRAADIVRYQANVQAADKIPPTPFDPKTPGEAVSAFRSGYRPDIAGAPLMGSLGVANAVGRGVVGALKNPTVSGALAGGAHGYLSKGWEGVIPGAIEFGVGGGMLGKAGKFIKAAGGLPGLLGATEAAAPAATTAGKIFLSEAEAKATDRALQMAAKRASQVGMAHAAGGTVRDRLLSLLGK